MTTETKSHYTIDEVALWNAGIDPYDCEGCVDFAAEDRLPGWELAVKYRDQIELQILNGELIPSIDNTPVEHIVDDDQPTVSADTPVETFHEQFLLSFDDAQNWRPAGNPFTSKPVKSRGDSHNECDLLIIGILTDQFYQEGERGGQKSAMYHIQHLAEKLHLSDKNLSDATLKRRLKAAREIVKAELDKK